MSIGPCLCGDAFCEQCNPGAAVGEAYREALLDLISHDLPEAINPDWLAQYIEDHAAALADWLEKTSGVTEGKFPPCRDGDHANCGMASTGLRRDQRAVYCTCACHAADVEAEVW